MSERVSLGGKGMWTEGFHERYDEIARQFDEEERFARSQLCTKRRLARKNEENYK